MGDNRDHVFSTWFSRISDVFSKQKVKKRFSDYIEEEQPLSSQKRATQDLVTHINVCLGSSQTRQDGASLLVLLLDQCSTEVYISGAKTWANLLLQAIQPLEVVSRYCDPQLPSLDPPPEHRLCCLTLGMLLKLSKDFPELHREFASSIIPNLLPALLSANEQWLPAAMECLRSCMMHFSGPCGLFKRKIENKLLGLLESDSTDISKCACSCFALLASCGGGGTNQEKYTEAWKISVDQILASLSVTLDAIYSNLDADFGSGAHDAAQALSLPEVTDDEPERCCLLVTRFSILNYTLLQLINQDYPAPVSVPVHDIIQLLCRILAITPPLLCKKPTADRLYLASVVPSLHCEVFKLLECLISSLQGNLILYSSTINKLFLQTLSWSQCGNDVYGQQRPHCVVRVAVYKALHLWLETLGCSSGMENYGDALIKQILKDTVPLVDNVKVSTSLKFTASTENLSKKRKKQAAREIGQLTSQRKIDMLANSVVCKFALKCLSQLVIKVGAFLKHELFKSIHELCVSTLLRVWQRPESPPLPYGSPECRKALCHMLLTCVRSPHPKWPPPTHCAVGLFSMGHADLNSNVKHFCCEALSICEVIIHPRAPSLAHSLTTYDLESGGTATAAPTIESGKDTMHVDVFGGTAQTSSMPTVIPVPRAIKRKFEDVKTLETKIKILKDENTGNVGDKAEDSERSVSSPIIKKLNNEIEEHIANAPAEEVSAIQIQDYTPPDSPEQHAQCEEVVVIEDQHDEPDDNSGDEENILILTEDDVRKMSVTEASTSSVCDTLLEPLGGQNMSETFAKKDKDAEESDVEDMLNAFVDEGPDTE